MERTDLKKCPFCGHDEINIFHFDPYDGYQGDLGRWKVRCTHCGVEISRKNRLEVIEAWNRRASDGT